MYLFPLLMVVHIPFSLLSLSTLLSCFTSEEFFKFSVIILIFLSSLKLCSNKDTELCESDFQVSFTLSNFNR